MAVASGGNGSSLKVPDGWLEYSCFGRPITGTRIIAMKTPLKQDYNNGLSKEHCVPAERGQKNVKGVPAEEEFTPQQCMERIARTFDKLQLRAIVNLSYTDKYYNKLDFTSTGIKHSMINVPGGGKVPSDSICERFSDTMDRFLSCVGKDGLVAVHCTHGINRTGYLVCRYLIRQLQFDPEAAIREFEEARGHSILKVIYVQHLREGCLRFHHVQPDSKSSDLSHGRRFPDRRRHKKSTSRADTDMNWRSKKDRSLSQLTESSSKHYASSYGCPSYDDSQWMCRDSHEACHPHYYKTQEQEFPNPGADKVHSFSHQKHRSHH